MGFNTDFCFNQGKLTTILDGQAGSSGKGKLGSFICQHASNWQFACNTFMPQAGHWVVLDDGCKFFYQTLNSCAYQTDKYEKLYIGPGATIELPAFFREMEENNVPRKKLGISPLTSILQDIDSGYERGTHDFNGDEWYAPAGSLDPYYAHQLVKDEQLAIETSNDGTVKVGVIGTLSHTPIVPGTIVVTVRGTDGRLAQIVIAADGRPESVKSPHRLKVTGGFDESTQLVNLLIDGLDYSNHLKATVEYEYKHEPSIAINEESKKHRLVSTISYGGKSAGGPLAATGTTAHGCGANRARRVLRRKEAKFARDIPELREFICDVPGEIMKRLDAGQAGLLEVAQGFQLSYLLPEMYPYTTSRNCTVAAGLDDMMLPPRYAGITVINFRTYPIRINSNKYIDKATGKHMTWQEVQDRLAFLPAMKLTETRIDESGIQTIDYGGREISEHWAEAAGITIVKGNSGPGYPDQQETSWEEVTRLSGAKEPIMEMTSVTKLPRRVFTFSKQNLVDAIRHNRANGPVYLALNFLNYVDAEMAGVRDKNKFSHKASTWVKENFKDHLHNLLFFGTGPRTDDYILIDTI